MGFLNHRGVRRSRSRPLAVVIAAAWVCPPTPRCQRPSHPDRPREVSSGDRAVHLDMLQREARVRANFPIAARGAGLLPPQAQLRFCP